MRYNIKKEDNTLEVKISISSRKFARDPVREVSTEEVLDLLEKEGYHMKEYDIKARGSCSNLNRDSLTEGTWIFKKKEKKNVKLSNNNKRPVSTKEKRTRSRRQPTEGEKNKLLGTKDMGGVQPQAQTSIPRPDKKVSG
jgi:hypothetical protein